MDLLSDETKLWLYSSPSFMECNVCYSNLAVGQKIVSCCFFRLFCNFKIKSYLVNTCI